MSTKAPLPYRFLLLLLPRRFRRDFGADLEAVLVERLRDARGTAARAWVWLIAVVDILTSAPAEWADALRHQRTGNAPRSNGMETVIQDAKYALRSLAGRPGFAAIATITLALGIGANTAIFSVVDRVLLRPAPFEAMERLMMVWETDRDSGTTREPASLPDYYDFRDRSETFETLAGFAAADVTVMPDNGDPVRVPAVASTHEFLPMVGIEPILGRTFTAGETRPGGGNVLLISEPLWERLYSRDPSVLGRTLTVDGYEYSVIGVVPGHADFGMLQILGSAAYSRGFADRGGRHAVGIWAPLQASPEEWFRGRHAMFMFGRLAPGVSRSAAQQEMTAIAADLEASYATNEGRGVNIEPLRDVVFGDVRPALLVLLGAVGLVLLIACANVANLLLARGTTRTREIAVRASLGADGPRLARQFLVEGVALALVGGGAGGALAVVGTDLLLAFAPADIPRLDTVGVDGRVLAVTLGISVVVGIVFGLVPTLQARRMDLQSTLRSERGVVGSGGAGRGVLRSGIVVAELALAIMLVVGAALLLKSFWQIRRIDPGFHAEGVLKAEFRLPPSRYPANFADWPNLEEIHTFNVALLERVRALPGVESAALAANGPLDQGDTNSLVIVGREAESADMPETSVRFTTPGYLGTVGIDLRRGRAFHTGDGILAPSVALINEAAVHQLFPDQDPIGQRIEFWGDQRRIVGVVENVRFHGLTANPPIAVYTPLAQTPTMAGGEMLLVRTAGDPETLAAGVRGAIHALDPQLAIFGVEPLARAVGRSVSQQRFTMLLLGVFAAVAVALALIGIHGVLSYLVARRTSEMGIRMALGARRADVLALIAGQGARLAFVGLALGLAGAFAATRLLHSILYEVSATDPATFAAVAVVVFAISMLAVFEPARRATRVDPMTSLRQE